MKLPPINQTSDMKPSKVEINEWLDGKVEINLNTNIRECGREFEYKQNRYLIERKFKNMEVLLMMLG